MFPRMKFFFAFALSAADNGLRHRHGFGRTTAVGVPGQMAMVPTDPTRLPLAPPLSVLSSGAENSELTIRQDIEWGEVLTDWEGCNSYSVFLGHQGTFERVPEGRPQLRVVETSDDCCRHCCRSSRSCELHVLDGQTRNRLLRIEKNWALFPWNWRRRNRLLRIEKNWALLPWNWRRARSRARSRKTGPCSRGIGVGKNWALFPWNWRRGICTILLCGYCCKRAV